MAQVSNLHRARKRKARADEAKRAAENRARFGRTPAQKERDAAEEAEARKRMDQIKRESGDEA